MMMRRALPWLAIGVLAIVIAAVWAWIGRAALYPSYLAAWLVWGGVPLGALMVLMLLEIGGGATALVLTPLFRALMIGTPVAALLFIPVLFGLHPLYAWDGAAGPGAPFGESWLHPGFFIGRAVVYLLIFTALAFLFAPARTPGARRPAAVLGLFIYVLVGTLAAIDWIMSLDPSLHSGEFGLLILVAQAATATAAAILVMAAAGLPMPRQAAVLLALLSTAWLLLQFLHYLVMWSGDLPKEVAWYLMRDADAGRTIEWLAVLGGFLVPVVLLIAPVPLRIRALPAAAAAVVAAHMLEALWFVTPVFRHHFALRGTDVLMMLGFGGIALGLAQLRLPRPAASPKSSIPSGVV